MNVPEYDHCPAERIEGMAKKLNQPPPGDGPAQG